MIETAALDAQLVKRQQRGLYVARDLGPRGVFQPMLQRGDRRWRRQRSRAPLGAAAGIVRSHSASAAADSSV